jgi:hypothetical protein
MKVLRKTSYKDGGTISLHTDEGLFFIDRRIKSKKNGLSEKIYKNAYPGELNSIEVTDKNVIKQLKASIYEYNLNIARL